MRSLLRKRTTLWQALLAGLSTFAAFTLFDVRDRGEEAVILTSAFCCAGPFLLLRWAAGAETAGPVRESVDLTKARVLYIGYWSVTVVAWVAMYLILSQLMGEANTRSTFGWVTLCYFLALGFFGVDTILSPLFKRKSRPWHFGVGQPPEDRWPRV